MLRVARSTVVPLVLLLGCTRADTNTDANTLVARAISAGNGFTCGLRTDSTAWCWGANQYGQLGVDSASETCKVDPVATAQCSRSPVAVSGGLRFASIDAGESHVCGLTSEERAYCWGENASGQLGILVSGATCAVEYYVQRGLGETLCARTPRAVETELRFTAISAGAAFTCALAHDGVAYCWGAWTTGRFGGVRDSIPGGRFARFDAGEPLAQLSADGRGVCALGRSGRVFCWGGDGRPVPSALATDIRFTSVSRGWRHGCGIAEDSTAYCWGENDSGQLGNGQVNPRFDSGDTTVQRVAGNVRYAAINAGFLSTCAVSIDGRQHCWGDGSAISARVHEGCLHVDTYSPCALRPVGTSLRDVVAMTSGFTHRCALRADGTVYCWGKSAGDVQRVANPARVRTSGS